MNEGREVEGNYSEIEQDFQLIIDDEVARLIAFEGVGVLVQIALKSAKDRVGFR